VRRSGGSARQLPKKRKPYSFHQRPRLRSYAKGEYRTETAGTFPQGCPVRHLDTVDTAAAEREKVAQ